MEHHITWLRIHLYYVFVSLQPVVMATKESVVVMERPRTHSTTLDRQATQVFETLAKKLHRLESRGMYGGVQDQEWLRAYTDQTNRF